MRKKNANNDDLFNFVKKDLVLQRKIFVIYEGAVTEKQFLDQLCVYINKKKIPIRLSSIENVVLLCDNTNISTIEISFVKHVKDKFGINLNDIKHHNDIFVYIMDFDRLRDEHDPREASKHRQRLIDLANFKKIPIKPVFSDPSFEYWLYIMATCRTNSPVTSFSNGRECRAGIIACMPDYVKPTKGAKCYSDNFYNFILNDQNINESIESSRKIREIIPVIKRIQNFNDIAVDEEMLNKLTNQNASYSLVDVLMNEIIL